MIKTKYTGVYYRDTLGNDRVFYITYKLNGKLTREKVGTQKEGVTAVYSSRIRAKKVSISRLGDDAPMHQNKKVPIFDEAAHLYFESVKDKSDTKNSIGRYENHLENTFGKLRLDEISSEIIRKFKAKMKDEISSKTQKHYAPKTINSWIDLISTIYSHAIRTQNLNIINPANNQKVEREKVDNDRERYLEKEEVAKLIEAIDTRAGKDELTYKLKLFLVLSLMTGARLTSVLTISKADVNLRQNTILIKNHKSNRTYTGFIHPKYKNLLEERMKQLSPIDYIVSGNNKEMHRTNISKSLQPLLNDLFNQGLNIDDRKRRVVVHTLRHTFASLLAIDGVPIYTIKKLMDHSDIEQTMRYAKLQPDAGSEAVAMLSI